MAARKVTVKSWEDADIAFRRIEAAEDEIKRLLKRAGGWGSLAGLDAEFLADQSQVLYYNAVGLRRYIQE